MDSALLTAALNSPELFQSIIEHFPSDLIEAELALLSQSQQLRFLELRHRHSAHELAQRVRQCSSWEEVEQAIAADPMYKNEAWALLTDEEKERIKKLKIAAAKLLYPNSASLVGKQVYVTEGTYRTAGEGVVECDRGSGTLRLLEVRMKDGKIQVLGLSDVRQVT
jgi:hypothetical protein